MIQVYFFEKVTDMCIKCLKYGSYYVQGYFEHLCSAELKLVRIGLVDTYFTSVTFGSCQLSRKAKTQVNCFSRHKYLYVSS